MTRNRSLRWQALVVAWGLIGTFVIMAEDRYSQNKRLGRESATEMYSLMNRKPEIEISSEEMQAWVISYQDFLSIDDLSAEQKNLEHYDIEFYDDDEHWIVYFAAKLLLDEKEQRRLKSMTFGRGTVYWVHKDTMQIVKRLFDA